MQQGVGREGKVGLTCGCNNRQDDAVSNISGETTASKARQERNTKTKTERFMNGTNAALAHTHAHRV